MTPQLYMEAYTRMERTFPELTREVFDDAWQNASREAQFEMLIRLVTSVIFEKLLPVEEVNVWGLKHKIVSRLRAMPVKLFQITLTSGEELCVPVDHHAMFARITPASHVIHKKKGGYIAEIDDPLVFYDLIASSITRFEISAERLATVRAMIINSMENLTLSICYKLVRARDPSPHKRSKSIYYEQLVTCGHTIHPLTKYRSNIHGADLVNILPELESQVSVAFVAVRKSHFRPVVKTGWSFQRWLPEELSETMMASLPEGTGDSYTLVPMHPWQFRNTLPGLFADEIADGTIIPLGEDLMPGDPTLSVRTIHTCPEGTPFYLKLPVNFQATSYVRSVSPAAVVNGVATSSILEHICDTDRRVAASLTLLPESEGGYFTTGTDGALTDREIAQAEQLSYIHRSSPEAVVSQGEIPIVTVALIDKNHLLEKPLIHSILEQYSDVKGVNRGKEAALDWYEKFCAIAIPGLITLLTRYGIGFEAHLQNTLIVISERSGEPLYLILRDLGGMRIVKPRLDALGLGTEFFPGALTLRDSAIPAQKKLFYSFYQSVLGELVATLKAEYEIKECDLWKPVYAITAQSFEELRTDHPHPEWVTEDFEAFIAPAWHFRSLFSMTLSESGPDYVETEMMNPFHVLHRALLGEIPMPEE